MLDGHLEAVGDRWRIRFTRRLAHPPARVWQALMDERSLAAWFPTTIEGELRTGAVLRYRFRGEEAAPIEGRMLEYRPPELMEFDWGGDILRIELRADGAGTLLTLYDTFGEQGKAARDAAGWHVCLQYLVRHLDRVSGDEIAWAPVFAAYRDRFGPAASTQGPPEGHPEAGDRS